MGRQQIKFNLFFSFNKSNKEMLFLWFDGWWRKDELIVVGRPTISLWEMEFGLHSLPLIPKNQRKFISLSCRIRRSKPQITNQPIRKSWLMWFVGFADGVRRCILHSSSIDLFDFVSSLPPSINHIDHECSMQPYCYNTF